MDRNRFNNVNQSVEIQDLDAMSKRTQGNVYRAVVVMSKKAESVGEKLKFELQGKLEEFASHSDTLEEITENREQIEISKYYEKLPSSTQIAISEFTEGNIHYK